MNMTVIPRKLALKNGLAHYFTGKACKCGHISKRYTSTAGCFECSAISRKSWRGENPEKTRAFRRNWRKKNPEKESTSHIKSNAKWWAKARNLENEKKVSARKLNPEKYRDQGRRSSAKRRLEKPDQVRSIFLKWKEKHPERHRELLRSAGKRFEKKHPLRGRIKAHDRRLKLRSRGTHSEHDIENIFRMQGGKCAYHFSCGTVLRKENMHIDHIVPISAGGPNDRRNLQLLCKRCNLSKGPKDPAIYARSLGMLI